MIAKAINVIIRFAYVAASASLMNLEITRRNLNIERNADDETIILLYCDYDRALSDMQTLCD